MEIITKSLRLLNIYSFAYPEALAEKINELSPMEKFCPKCNQWDCGAGAAGGDCVYANDDPAILFHEDKK